MTDRPRELQELIADACALEAEAVGRAWDATKGVHAPPAAIDALSALMGLFERANQEAGTGSFARFWTRTWAVLREDLHNEDISLPSSVLDPHRMLVNAPASWPHLRNLISWSRRFEGSSGARASVVCSLCGRHLDSYVGIVSDVEETHLAMHKNKIRGALLGLAAGDQVGYVAELAITLAKERSNARPSSFEACRKGYLQWLESDRFDLVAAGFTASASSSVGACIAAVAALDPFVQESEQVETLAADLARDLGCGDLGVSAAVVTAIELRALMLDRQLTVIQRRAGSAVAGRARVAPEDAARLHFGRSPEGVFGLPLAAEKIRTTAFQDRSDDVRHVIVASRHFDHISLLVHTALSRARNWAAGPHPVQVLAGFRVGARYGAQSVKESMFAHLTPEKLSAVKEAADVFAALWARRV